MKTLIGPLTFALVLVAGGTCASGVGLTDEGEAYMFEQVASVAGLDLGLLTVGQEPPAPAVKVEITDPNFSVSAVTALTKSGTGACVSYRLVTWKDAELQADAGALVTNWDLSTIDPFVGLSTNIRPVDEWLQNAVSIDTSWGLGYGLVSKDAFAYMAAKIKF